MLHLKNIVKTAPMAKDMSKFLPVAVNSQQSRSYSDHKVPERLQHIPTAQNPKFFDMVSEFLSRIPKQYWLFFPVYNTTLPQ